MYNFILNPNGVLSWLFYFVIYPETLLNFSKVAGKDTSEHAGKANELCFVVKCFILRQNIKFAYWLQLHGVRWGPIRDMYRNWRKSRPEVDGSSGRCRLEVAWPVCGVLVVGRTCSSGTPTWSDKARQVGSHSYRVVPGLLGFTFLFLFLFFKLPPLEPS